MNEHIRENGFEILVRRIGELGNVAVAFSGGVDSTLLLAAAMAHHRRNGAKVLAITAHSAIHPESDLLTARAMARHLNAPHTVISVDPLSDPAFLANPPDRCYHCKKKLFARMLETASGQGIHHLLHGANVDDYSDHRPGHEAAKELGAIAPLALAGIGKAEIRAIARSLGLPNWDRPSMACLASRIPYGDPVERPVLEKIAKAEAFLSRLGFETARVRVHGDVARIEVSQASIRKLAADEMRHKVAAEFKAIGFTYVSLDLEGYETGRLNRVLQAP